MTQGDVGFEGGFGAALVVAVVSLARRRQRVGRSMHVGLWLAVPLLVLGGNACTAATSATEAIETTTAPLTSAPASFGATGVHKQMLKLAGDSEPSAAVPHLIPPSARVPNGVAMDGRAWPGHVTSREATPMMFYAP